MSPFKKASSNEGYVAVTFVNDVFDDAMMQRCLELAVLGRRRVGNGALVGSVLVRDGSIVAEGYHAEFGKEHAERALLEKFDQKIDSYDVLYVSLEPCCHHGKTPPCTDIILEKGVKHVVYGLQDPDPRMRGRGIGQLRAAGVSVRGSINPAACERVNRGFISARTKQRPWIVLKQSTRMDGAIANPDGTPLKITSHEQDVWSHTYLRDQVDAILVGVKTVINDNPSLNTRFVQRKSQEKAIPEPHRLILDPHLRIPTDAKVLTDENHHRTIIVTCSESSSIDQQKKKNLEANGIRMFAIDFNDGSFALDQLWPHLLKADGDFYGLTSILVEGGARTWELFRKSGCVDEEVILRGR